MRHILSALLATTLLLGPLQAAEFSDAQKSEMGSIIREYLLENPEVLRDALIALQQREDAKQAKSQKDQLKQNADAIFRYPGDFTIGNPDASVTLVEFFDYNCGYCKKSLPTILELLETDKDLKIVFKEFPILSPGSVMAAKAAIAARQQNKYWELHQAFMGFAGSKDEAAVLAIAEKTGLDMEKLKKDMEGPEVAEILSANSKLARAIGVEGTPGFIVDETLIPGAVGVDALTAMIADIRANGGCKLC
jgi:protein-disulfide isomerase